MLTDSQKRLLTDLHQGWRLYTSKGAPYLVKGKDSKGVDSSDLAVLIESCVVDPVGSNLRIQWVPSKDLCGECFSDPCVCTPASSGPPLGGPL